MFTSVFLTSTSSNNNPPLPGKFFVTIASLIATTLSSSILGFSGVDSFFGLSGLVSPGTTGFVPVLFSAGVSGFVSVLFPLGGITFPPTFLATALTSSIVFAAFNSALNFNLYSLSLSKDTISFFTFVFSLPTIAALVFSC